MQPSSVKPRHVLCFLGKDGSVLHPPNAVAKTIADFGFEIDRTYSQAQPDPHMARSFGVCWDRVFPNAWSAADEAAVANHKSVLYVVSPPMEQQQAVAYSAAALRIVEEMIVAGATAVKGESAGVARGLKRWLQLAGECKAAAKTNQGLALTAAMGRTCRLAFAKRPLDGAAYNESVGFHLVGLPEIYVAKARGSDRDAVKIMDEIADAWPSAASTRLCGIASSRSRGSRTTPRTTSSSTRTGSSASTREQEAASHLLLRSRACRGPAAWRAG